MFFWLFGLFTSSIVWHKESNTMDLFHPETEGCGDTYLILSDGKTFFQHTGNLSLRPIVAEIIASAVFSHCFPAIGIIICCGQCGGTPNSDAHNINTEHSSEFHALTPGQSKYSEAIYCTGIMLLSYLPSTVESLDHDRKYLSQQ
jgi:hypothetical protein